MKDDISKTYNNFNMTLNGKKTNKIELRELSKSETNLEMREKIYNARMEPADALLQS